MDICILGCGNVGVAMATDLSMLDHKVTVIKTSSKGHNSCYEKLKGDNSEVFLKENGKFTSTKIHKVTDDLSLIKESKIVFVTIQTQYHEDLIKRAKDFFVEQQIVVFVPSYMSSFYMKKYVCKKNVNVVEMTGTPIEGRIEENMFPGKIVFRVGSRLKKNFISISGAEYVMKYLKQIKYGFTERYSPIEAGLLNPNLILHTSGSIMSIPRIEKAKEKFCMYHEAFSRENVAMMRIVESLDIEKNAVLNKLGYESVPFIETADFWGDNALDKFYDYAESSDRANAPQTIYSRYITEDVSQGLVLLESIAKLINVNVPLVSALINIASSALDYDFRRNGRTLEKLNAVEYVKSLVS